MNSSNLYKEFHLNTKNFEGKMQRRINSNYDLNPQPKRVFIQNKLHLPYLEKQSLLHEAMISRKSYDKLDIRIPIELSVVSELLQLSYLGKNNGTNQVTNVPSAGGRYSTSLYLAVFNVIGLEQGIYYWDSFQRILGLVASGDFREELSSAIVDINKADAENCSFAILITSNLEQTCSKYGDRGYRFVCMDIGYISQNLYVNSSHLNIATRALGGFYDDKATKMIPNNSDDVMLVHLFGKEPQFPSDQLNLDIKKYFQ